MLVALAAEHLVKDRMILSIENCESIQNFFSKVSIVFAGITASFVCI